LTVASWPLLAANDSGVWSSFFFAFTDYEGIMDAMQPASGWFMYEIEETAKGEKQDNEDIGRTFHPRCATSLSLK
jgi:hypothetical protein